MSHKANIIQSPLLQSLQPSGIAGTFKNLDALLGVLPTAIAVLDVEMRYLMVNKQWLHDYKLADRDVIDQSHYNLIPDLPEVWKGIYDRALNGETFTNNEDRFERADGSVMFLSWRVLPWFNDEKIDNPKPDGLILISQDITRNVAKQLNREVRLSESVDIVRQRVEILSKINAALAEAEDEVAVLSSLAALTERIQSDVSTLFYTDINEDGVITNLSVVAAQQANEQDIFDGFSSTAEIELHRFPILNSLLRDLNAPILIENIDIDPRFKTGSQSERAFLSKLGKASLALLPLKTGGRWQSLLVFGWTEPQSNESEVIELFKAIVAARRAQLSYEADRERSNMLALVNAILLRASAEEEFMSALAAFTDFNTLTLDYIDVDEAQNPLLFSRVSVWRDRMPYPEASDLNQHYAAAELPTLSLWLATVEALVFIEDRETDSRLDATMRDFLTKQDIRAALLMPLQAAGSWQALITIGWKAPHNFSKDERFIYEDIAQIAASLITSRRAYLAEEAARQSAQVLLHISTSLSQAVSEDDILVALASYTDQIEAAAIHLYYVDIDDSGLPVELKAVASWRDGQAWYNNPAFETSLNLKEVPGAQTLVKSSDALLFINDLNDARTNKQIDSNLRERLLATDHRSLISIPLYSSGRWQGLLTIHWAKPRDFTNHEQNILTALAITVSSVVASRRLYIQTLENVVRLRDLDTLKNEFMSSMSHELRTPLNAVIGLTDIILNGLDGELPPRAESDIRTVYNAGQQLLAIVNDVLDIAKIEAGHLTLMMTESNIQEPILEALDTATVMAENKQLTLLNSVPDNLPSVNIDKARLRQILLNLLSNAIKFTEQGTVEISAKVENELLIVCVRDEGIGIDPQHHGLVFEQFRQVEGALTRKKGGTGLGLPISKRLAEMHGGQMWLESELSKGCKFYFSLPLR